MRLTQALRRSLPGIHHVTAVAADPQQNLDFYTGIMGLRMVKQTVNFDSPTTYHLYYGNGAGEPGTILTFFIWPQAPKGLQGSGQLTSISFVIPPNTLTYWEKHLDQYNIPFTGPTGRFADEEVISFEDPDGLHLELISEPSADLRKGSGEGEVPQKAAIRGFYSITLSLGGYEATSTLLTRTLGFKPTLAEGNRFRYETGKGGPGAIVDILCQPDAPTGLVGTGSIHHVAWRTPNDTEQTEWRDDLVKAGVNVTPIIDRKYFHSIYFREPGGALFEIATDPPGFLIDERREELGSRLQLPAWLEPMRTQLEQILPPIQPPKHVQAR